MIDVELIIKVKSIADLAIIAQQLNIKDIENKCIRHINNIKTHSIKDVEGWQDIAKLLDIYKSLSIGELYRKLNRPQSYKTFQRRISFLHQKKWVDLEKSIGKKGNRTIVTLKRLT